MKIEDFKAILNEAEATPITICLDWLSVLLVDRMGKVPEARESDDIQEITEVITLRYYGKGNEHYKYIWHVLYHGEHVASLLSHTRNEKFVKKGAVKLDFKNHLLYTNRLWPTYHEIVNTFSLGYKNISRMDIAIDGMNYMLDFMNAYVRQTKERKVVELKGRGRINSKVLDRPTMYYHNFNLGTSSSPKYVTVYNKSLDISKNGKLYIFDYWKQNQVVSEVDPVLPIFDKKERKKLEKEGVSYLEGYKNIYRFEMRIQGTIVKQTIPFSLDLLKSPAGLMSLVKRYAQNYFEFVHFKRSDTSKCPGLEVMPYNRFKLQSVDVVREKPVDDSYKARLAVKMNVRQLYKGELSPDDYAAAQHIIFCINLFEYQKWYSKRLPGWIKEFSASQPNKEYCDQVTQFLIELKTRFEEETEGELL